MNLLVYTDGGPTAGKALTFAARWALQLDAELAVATVRGQTHAMETPPPLGREVPAAEWGQLPEGLKMLTAAARRLAETGAMTLPAAIVIRETPHGHDFACQGAKGRTIGFHECFGSFIEALNREIDRHRYDLLVVAPPRRGRMHRMLLGDTTRKLALELHTSVLIVRKGGPQSPLVVCADGSASGRRAFPLLHEMLPAVRRPVELLWVRPPGTDEGTQAKAEHCLRQARQWLNTCGKTARIRRLDDAHPADAIAEAVGGDALILIGGSLRHDVYRRTRGSLPIRLLARTEASVLLAKVPPEADPGTYDDRFAC